MSVLADAANVSEGGKLNLLGVFHALYAVSVPCQHPNLSIVLTFEPSGLDYGTRQHVAIRLIDADGKPIATMPDSYIDVPMNAGQMTPPHLNLIATIGGLVFERFGLYRFDVSVNGVAIAEIPLQVARLEQRQGPGMPPPPPVTP